MNLSVTQNSLLLYKGRPALAVSVKDKVEIETDDGALQKVRVKDVEVVHPGPIKSLAELKPMNGEVEEAWRLLEGSETTLKELAELLYGDYTPAGAWSAWLAVADGLYFTGTPEKVAVKTDDEVNQAREHRDAKEIETRERAEFIERVRSGKTIPEDAPRLADVERFARGEAQRCRLLADLGMKETADNAHDLLLKLGRWDETVNPHPRREGVTLTQPPFDSPELSAEDRLDLTHLTAYAIDDEESSDPDDAISIDGDTLWVHVADVSAMAPPDSGIDIEARGRGVNLYLPEGVVHMLPKEVTDTLGLGLGETSPTLSIGLRLNAGGEITDVRFERAIARVTRATYEEAEKRLGEEPFRQMMELAEVFRQRRETNGAVFIETPEVKIHVMGGDVIIRPLAKLKSRNMVMEAMLMAGEAVAKYALEYAIPLPFTTQAPPDFEGRPTTLSGMYALRRRMKRSQMKSVPGPHAGLGLPVYAQSTSPLRRYLDLVVHQQIRARLTGSPAISAEEALNRVGSAEAVIGSARSAERLSNRHWTLVWLMKRPEFRCEGIVVDKRGGRGMALIPQIGLETDVDLPMSAEPDSIVTLELSDVDLPRLSAVFRVAR
jgi:exoribonuclease-2